MLKDPAHVTLAPEYIGIAAVIFDRDGVLIEDTGFPHRPEHLHWMPGALETLRELHEQGVLCLVATNQSGVARGYVPEAQVEAFHQLMQDQVVASGGYIDAFVFCPHLPDAPVQRYRSECDCRKPRPGLVNQLLRQFALDPDRAILIGDRARDVEAGEAAGVRGFLYAGGDLWGFTQKAMSAVAKG